MSGLPKSPTDPHIKSIFETLFIFIIIQAALPHVILRGCRLEIYIHIYIYIYIERERERESEKARERERELLH